MFANRLPVKRTNPKTALAISGASKSVFGGNLAEGRTSDSTFIENGVLQTAAANVPVWENGGLRHEGADTNLIFRSEELDNAAYWQTASNVTVTANNVVGIFGNITAEKITEVATTSTHRLSANNNSGIVITNAVPVYITAFLKKGTRRYNALSLTNNAGNHQVTQWIDLDNGILGSNSTIGAQIVRNSCTIQSLGNGYFKIVLAVTPTGIASNLLYIILLLTNADNTVTYLGDIGEYGYATGIECKSTLSSYIPTTTAAVTRATCALSIPLVLNTNFYQRSAILMRVRAKHASSATAKSWLTPSTTAEGLIDNGSGALTFKDSAANTATADLTSWAADTVILVSIVTDDITGLMSLSASKDNGVTWVTSTDTTFAGLTVGANWLFFSANTQVFELLGFKVKKSNKGFAQMKSWAMSHALSETQ